MEQTIAISKAEYLEFLNLFKANTTELIEPMPSFFGEGAFEVEDAIDFINNLDDDKLPETFVVCGRLKNDEYWNSAYIYKVDGGFQIVPDNMVPIQDRFSKDIKGAILEAQKTVADYEEC